jgi:hypothetical protein
MVKETVVFVYVVVVGGRRVGFRRSGMSRHRPGRSSRSMGEIVGPWPMEPG